MAKFIDLLKNTIEEIQNDNRNNPNEETADASIFDFLKDKLGELNNKTNANVQTRDGNPVSIFDFIKAKIEEAQNKNATDRSVPTAPGSVFDKMRNKVEQYKKQQNTQRYDQRAEESIADVIQEYGIDVRNLNRDILIQVQQRYAQDNKNLDIQYAKYLQQLNMKATRV